MAGAGSRVHEVMPWTLAEEGPIELSMSALA
jgi:hypothetical protein